MSLPDLTHPDSLDSSVLAFHIASPCGRTYRLLFDDVKDDYVEFLMESDGLSRQEATEQASFGDVESWFREQFGWGDIDRLAQCVEQPTPAQIHAALNLMRGGSSASSLAQLIECDDLVSAKDEARLSQALPPAQARPAKPPSPRM